MTGDERVERFPAHPTPVDHGHLAAVLRNTSALVKARYRRLADGETPGPPVVILLDEVQDYVRHPAFGPVAARQLVDIAKVGRAVQVTVRATAPEGEWVPPALRSALNEEAR